MSARRAGGRAARRALRAAPLAEDARAVRPGMEGGRYRPLTDIQVDAIHRAVLRVLSEIGLSQAPDSGVEAMVAYGAVPKGDRLTFPEAVIEKALGDAPAAVTLHGRDPAHDLSVGGNRVHYGTAGAAVHVADLETGEYRESTLADLHEAARLADRLDNIHFFQRCMVARDLADPREMDVNTLYASVTGTLKHVGTSFTEAAFVRESVAMLHMIAGGEAAWRARPFVSNSNCFVVPPLKFATESCLVLEEVVRAGMPVLLLSAGQAGATSPAPLAGSVMQAVAECLAGLVYVQALSPGAPAIFGTWPFVSDLRTGAMCGGSAEQALLTAACAQMGRHYDLPTGAAGGMADAKFPAFQGGAEHGVTSVMAGLAGLNMVYESAGMYASLLGFSPEGMILDDDVLGQCLRCVRGIEVTDETLDVAAMAQICLEGPGHYLGSAQTLGLMQSEYFYPAASDRTSPKEWAERGKPDLVDTAKRRKAALLAQPPRATLEPGLDAEIRAAFPIRL